MKCVAFAGYFLDISDIDMKENKEFGMSYMYEERNYKSVRVSSIFKPEYAHEKKVRNMLD